MKKIYLLIAFFTLTNLFSQFNENAPWVQDAKNQAKNESFQNQVTLFNTYWKNKDHNKKGSGYKPFKRWEYKWKDELNAQGNLISPQEMATAFQQKINSKNNTTARGSYSLPPSNWQPIGPYNNAVENTRARGRVNVVVADPANSNTLYFGTPAGGIWKSTNHGSSWIPLTDNLPQLGVSGIAIDYSNSNTIYIATGDKDAGDTYSIGVMKSTDGGLTWSATGLAFTNTSTRAGDLLIHPTNNQILWCATNNGIYKTTNAGATWTNVLSGSFAQGSLRLKPNDPTVVYAVSNNKFYRSTNTGDTFANITSGMPLSSGRLVLDITPADANYVYILSATTSNSFQGIYRSTNGGTSFSKTSNGSTPAIFGGSTQAWYDMALGVSSTNKDEIYTGLLDVWKSTNGGTGFTKLNDWSVYNPAFTHADIHFLRFINNKLYCGSDGGVYTSSDGGVNFSDITTGAQIGQFYKISVARESAAKIVGGTQDNGGWVYNSVNSNPWQSYHGGDGMDCAVNPANNNNIYGFVYNGGTLFTSGNTGTSLNGAVSAPSGESGNWVTPLKLNSVGEVFSGYSKLFKLNTNTLAWTQQNTSDLGTGNIVEIEVAPSNDNIIFLSKGTKLYKSTDGGINFTNLYTAPASITSICVNYSNTNLVYLTTAGTGGEALKSTNGGANFVSFSTNLPAIAKKVIKHQGRNSLNPLYIGTSLGVYYRDDSMSQWEPFDANLPNVAVADLEINLEDNIIIAGTYGRGIWQCAIPVETPPSDVKFVSIQSPTTQINCNNVISPEVTVKNNGSNAINTVNVTYDYDGNSQSYTWNGTILSQSSQTITLPNITVATKGAYNLNISTSITGDAYADNNTGKSTFYINDAGTLNVVNTFESATTNLLTHSDGLISSQWQRGISTNGALATSGNNVYTVSLSGNYPDNKKAYLYSQCYDLTNAVNPQIKFDLGFDLEENWDVVYVEYSTNMGATWTVLGSQGANWYNSNRTNASSGAADDCQNCPGAQWTGVNTTMTNYFYPLNSLIGQSNVLFRIVFHSDEGVNQLGANVDNFVIEGTLSNQNFELKNIAIFPNPSAAIFNISSGNKKIDSVEVYDVSGKIILTKVNTASVINEQVSLDLTNVAKGIYFVKIYADGLNTVKRIIKN